MPLRVQVLFVAGASGSGKTTVGRLLARRLGWDFLEGDSLHLPDNIQKMASGQALEDADRRPWLQAIAAAAAQAIRDRRPVVITCSALKKSYRSILGVDQPEVELVFLKAAPARLIKRLRKRRGHFFPAGLLESQLAILEEPERGWTLDASRPAEQIVSEIQMRLMVLGQ